MTWANRLRDHLRRRAVVLRRSFVQLLQMAVAASLSWWVAYDLLGHTQSVFAPVAAAIVVRLAPGMRTKRALEMVAGIAVGIGAGDAIVRVIGTGAVQVGVVVLVAVSAAVLLGAGNLIASQAAGTAILVAALPSNGSAPTRFVDALVGGLIGLAVLLAVPRSPRAALRRVIDPFLIETAGTLADAADALEQADADRATAAVHRAHRLGRLGRDYAVQLEQSREAALISPVRWNQLGDVERYEQAAPHVDSLARDSRELCRAVRDAIESGSEWPAQLPASIRGISDATAELPHLLRGAPDDGDVIGLALASAADAVTDRSSDLAVGMIVGQLQAAAVDVLRVLGVDRLEATAHLRAARE
jgi:uncharacterized membrane protein YgaE (UPF0421/DUF939 family)